MKSFLGNFYSRTKELLSFKCTYGCSVISTYNKFALKNRLFTLDVEKKYLLVSDARKSFENNAKNEDKVLAEAAREKTKIISVLKGPR